MLQSDEPKIRVMLQMIHSLVLKLLGRFMKVGVLTNEHLICINVGNRDNYLTISILMIGFLTRSTMTAQEFLPHKKHLVSEYCLHFMSQAYKFVVSPTSS